MSANRASAIKEIFLEASDLAVEDRERFLAERCGDDATLRSAVANLLAADVGAHSRFLEGLAGTPVAMFMPSQIGRFRVLRRIGEGGMGIVFEAEQDRPCRRVALKVIRTAMASEALLRRFEFEVQVLGRLKHPGIAQIYEAGTFEDGSSQAPYFAMEYVEGCPLTEYARRHGLSVCNRLELMVEICEAVHYAHQKGVIHRDLKPANVLVEESEGSLPRTKILDFGVACAVRPDLGMITMHTEAGQLVGTLAYMSPEQITGHADQFDVRSDVYTLGVLLFELLAERLPYDLRDRSLVGIGNAIQGQEAARLSSIDGALRGDLETIVAKALAKQKERRYESAAELAADVRRYLRNEPVIARPPTRRYLLRKFAARNKALVGGVAAVTAALVLGLIGTGTALIRATRAEAVALHRLDESRRAAAEASAINQFLQEMITSIDPARALGQEVTIRQALDGAAARIESDLLGGQPAIEAGLRTTIGMTYLALGHYTDAEPHLSNALELRRRWHGDASPQTAEALVNLAALRGLQDRHTEEEAILREALDARFRLYGEMHTEVASTMQSLAASLRRQHKYDEAEGLYRRALAMRRELLGTEHVDVAQSLNSLALLLQDEGDYAAAEPLFREALVMRRRLLGEKHPVLAGALNNLANLLRLSGQFAETELLLREALHMRRELLGDEHPEVAQSLNNLAFYLYETGDNGAAEPLYREALAIWRTTLPPGHADIGNCAAGLGLVLVANGAFGEAEPLLREALAIREATLPSRHWARFTAMSALGASLTGLGRYVEAEQLLKTAYDGLQQPRVAVHHKRKATQRLVELYECWGRPQLGYEWRARLMSEGSASNDREP